MNKKREDALVKSGLVLMRICLVSFLITLFYYYAMLILTRRDPFLNGQLWLDPFFTEALIFTHGLVAVLIGLLIGRLKKQESL